MTSNINAMATAGISTSSSDEFDPANSTSRFVVEKLKGVHTVITEIDDERLPTRLRRDRRHRLIQSPRPSKLGDFSVEAEEFRLSFDVFECPREVRRVVRHHCTPPVLSLVGVESFDSCPMSTIIFRGPTPVQLTMPAFPCKSVSGIHRVQDMCLANRAPAESRE